MVVEGAENLDVEGKENRIDFALVKEMDRANEDDDEGWIDDEERKERDDMVRNANSAHWARLGCWMRWNRGD